MLGHIHNAEYPLMMSAEGVQVHVSRKSKRLIHQCHGLCDSVLSYKRNSWEFEHIIKNRMGNEIWSIYNDKYFEILTFNT